MIDTNLQWQAGTALLDATQILIDLPPGVRITNKGCNPASSFFRLYPSCPETARIFYSKDRLGEESLDFILDYKTHPNNSEQAIFLPGYGEGNLCYATGNLTVLHQKLENLGIEKFSFFNIETAQASDRAVREILKTRPERKQFIDFLRLSLEESEPIAYLGGLVALCQANVDRGLIQAVEHQIRTRQSVKEYLEDAGGDLFERKNILLAVHDDTSELSEFVRQEIKERVETYQCHGLPVYSFSTSLRPLPCDGMIQISSPSGSVDNNYGLTSQLDIFRKKLEGTPKIEVVGISWLKCVEITRGFLQERGIDAQINYDCTDLVVDYVALQKNNLDLGRGAPTTSRRLLRKYGKATGEYAKHPQEFLTTPFL